MKNCGLCKRKCIELSDFQILCVSHDFCSFERDERKPLYNMSVAKQLLFDCAVELNYTHDESEVCKISDKIFDIIKEMDKM